MLSGLFLYSYRYFFTDIINVFPVSFILRTSLDVITSRDQGVREESINIRDEGARVGAGRAQPNPGRGQRKFSARIGQLG